MRAGSLIDGRYRLEAPLGAGGFGEVWRAGVADEPGAVVALKVLRPARHADVDRFRREARLLEGLSHPRIVRTLGSGVLADGRLYIVLEYVDGEPLSRALRRWASGGVLPAPASVAAVIGGLAEALAHVHAQGLVHRDVKPANVIITARDEVKLIDFGIAKEQFLGPDSATTQGRRLGTLAYMAPEQLRREDVDGRTDVFALGVVAFELLTLRWAWRRDDAGGHLTHASDPSAWSTLNGPDAVMERILHGERPQVTALRPELSSEVDRVIARATAGSRADRLFPITALAEQLAAALAVQTRATSAATRTDVARPALEGERYDTVVRPQPLDARELLLTPIEPERKVEARGGGTRRRSRWLEAALVGAAVALVAAAWMRGGEAPRAAEGEPRVTVDEPRAVVDEPRVVGAMPAVVPPTETATRVVEAERRATRPRESARRTTAAPAPVAPPSTPAPAPDRSPAPLPELARHLAALRALDPAPDDATYWAFVDAARLAHRALPAADQQRTAAAVRALSLGGSAADRLARAEAAFLALTSR